MQSWKPWILVLVIFALGAVAGAFGMRAYMARQIPLMLRPTPGQLEDRILEHIDHEVGLTDAQKSALKPIVKTAVERADAIHKSVRDDVEKGFREMDDAIAAKLDPGQRERFAEFRARMEKFRRQGPPPGPPFGPPPGMGPGFGPPPPPPPPPSAN